MFSFTVLTTQFKIEQPLVETLEGSLHDRGLDYKRALKSKFPEQRPIQC